MRRWVMRIPTKSSLCPDDTGAEVVNLEDRFPAGPALRLSAVTLPLL
jgi:hypothetical protein